MKKLFFLLLLPQILLSQNRSLNTFVGYEANERVGLMYQQEEGFVRYQLSASSSMEDKYASVKMGFELVKKLPFRVHVYPVWFDWKIGTGYRTPTEIQISKPFNRLNLTGSVLWAGEFYGGASLQYALLGKQPEWKPNMEYKISKSRVIGWSLCVVGGAAWGTHEALYADPKILEKRFGFSETSWGGSRAWEGKYPNGDYQEGESPAWFKDKTNVFREAKKTTGFLGRYLPIAAGIVITLDKKRNWLDYAAGFLLYSGSSALTYNLLRY